MQNVVHQIHDRWLEIRHEEIDDDACNKSLLFPGRGTGCSFFSDGWTVSCRANDQYMDGVWRRSCVDCLWKDERPTTMDFKCRNNFGHDLDLRSDFYDFRRCRFINMEGGSA